MNDVLSKGSLFPESLIPEMINKVRGKSSLAKLCEATPISFNGRKEFTFSFDKEVDLVAENGAKSKGGVTVTPITIIPVKVEYGARISDEYDIASEEAKMDYLKQFADGFQKKVARGLDIMAFHGFNPRTGAASTVIGTNHFDSQVTQIVTTAANVTADANMEAAIALIQGSDRDVSGAALAPAFRSALAALTLQSGAKMFPELAWGNAPGAINGLTVDVNSTVAMTTKDLAVVGDFANSFRWGYSKEIPLEIIRYGNPDNDATLGDLKGHNQIYLRGEMYLGWAVLDPSAFAIIRSPAT